MRLFCILILVTTLQLGVTSVQAKAEDGKAIFERTCSSCHGMGGLGDGPVAAALPPEQKPRNFVEGKYRYATDRSKMKEVITKGGAAFGMSPIMAPIPLSESELDAVVDYVYSLKK